MGALTQGVQNLYKGMDEERAYRDLQIERDRKYKSQQLKDDYQKLVNDELSYKIADLQYKAEKQAADEGVAEGNKYFSKLNKEIAKLKGAGKFKNEIEDFYDTKEDAIKQGIDVRDLHPVNEEDGEQGYYHYRTTYNTDSIKDHIEQFKLALTTDTKTANWVNMRLNGSNPMLAQQHRVTDFSYDPENNEFRIKRNGIAEDIVGDEIMLHRMFGYNRAATLAQQKAMEEKAEKDKRDLEMAKTKSETAKNYSNSKENLAKANLYDQQAIEQKTNNQTLDEKNKVNIAKAKSETAENYSKVEKNLFDLTNPANINKMTAEQRTLHFKDTADKLAKQLESGEITQQQYYSAFTNNSNMLNAIKGKTEGERKEFDRAIRASVIGDRYERLEQQTDLLLVLEKSSGSNIDDALISKLNNLGISTSSKATASALLRTRIEGLARNLHADAISFKSGAAFSEREIRNLEDFSNTLSAVSVSTQKISESFGVLKTTWAGTTKYVTESLSKPAQYHISSVQQRLKLQPSQPMLSKAQITKVKGFKIDPKKLDSYAEKLSKMEDFKGYDKGFLRKQIAMWWDYDTYNKLPAHKQTLYLDQLMRRQGGR